MMERGPGRGCGVVASIQTGFNRREEQIIEQKAAVLAGEDRGV